MIKNVVFDFGQVLIQFVPSYIISQYTTDSDDASLLEEVLFDRLYWDRLDDGSIDNEQILSHSASRLPDRLHDTARRILYGWTNNLPEIDGMHDLVVDLKNQYGVKLVLLSNIADYFADHISEFPILSHFDGYVLSGVCKRVKPRPEIFAYLCEQFDLVPSETVFVDDNPANIAGARDFGINAYLFDGDSARLRAYLDQVIEKK